jgi:hypothetical protein
MHHAHAIIEFAEHVNLIAKEKLAGHGQADA